MAPQLPPEAYPDAGGMIFYSIVCLLASITLLLLLWVHGELNSYVAILALGSGLSAISSTTRLIICIVSWRDVHWEMFRYAVENYGNPSLVVFGTLSGPALGVFCIQYYAVNMEAVAIAAWAIDLTVAIYQLPISPAQHKTADRIAKASCFILPAIQQGLLQVQAIQSNSGLFFFVGNCIMGFGMITSAILIIPMLWRYIRTRRQLSAVAAGSISTLNSKDKMYDKWLVVRFTFAFLMLVLFQILTVFYQVVNAYLLQWVPYMIGPILTINQAKADMQSFAPGITGSLVNFIVFGTTKTYRQYMWRKLVPRRIRDAISARRAAAAAAAGGRRQSRPGTTTTTTTSTSVVKVPTISSRPMRNSRVPTLSSYSVAAAPSLASSHPHPYMSSHSRADAGDDDIEAYPSRSGTDDFIILQEPGSFHPTPSGAGSERSDSNEFIILQRMEDVKVKDERVQDDDDDYHPLWSNPLGISQDGSSKKGGRRG